MTAREHANLASLAAQSAGECDARTENIAITLSAVAQAHAAAAMALTAVGPEMTAPWEREEAR